MTDKREGDANVTKRRKKNSGGDLLRPNTAVLSFQFWAVSR